MADSGRALDVWCFDRLAGTLVDADPALRFSYDQRWLADAMPPLSQSLPLDGSYENVAVSAFFGGLLPEGVPREILARRLGVSDRNDFSMLAAVGGDTAGAISLQPPGRAPEPDVDDVQWLDDAALITLIDELPSRPMHADEDGEFRLSLAGAQDKLPVVLGDDGRIGLTRGQTPSTHILKTPIQRLDGTVVNEAMGPAVGLALGIEAVTAKPHRVGDREFLLIERYDRIEESGRRRRLHQEDFCQALGIPTERKYEAEGGPSLADCFALLRKAADVPAREIVRLLDDVALSFLVGNHDAHGKNYSLLYVPGTSRAVLAPAYDIISTYAYHRSHGLTRKMAMKIGGQYKPEYLEPRHLDRLLGDAGLGAAAARRRLRDHARQAPAAARAVRARLARDDWDAPVLDRIVEIVERRAEMLAVLAAPARASGARPIDTDIAVGPRIGVVAGQRWRDSTRDGVAPTVIEVQRVDADGTVHGVASSRDGVPAGAGAWSGSDFQSFVLLDDPQLPTYVVAAKIDIDDPRATALTRTVGEVHGVRGQTLTPGGLGGPEASWEVVASTESEALDIVRRVVGPDVEVRPARGWADEP